jgi:hypothetical protein
MACHWVSFGRGVPERGIVVRQVHLNKQYSRVQHLRMGNGEYFALLVKSRVRTSHSLVRTQWILYGPLIYGSVCLLSYEHLINTYRGGGDILPTMDEATSILVALAATNLVDNV